MIRKYKKLPSEPRDYSGSGRPIFAFGHDPRDNDYKVVRIVEFSKEDMPLLDFGFKVYSLTLLGKKIEEELPMKECSICSSWASLNGAIHWLIALPCGPPYSPRPESLLAFDLCH